MKTLIAFLSLIILNFTILFSQNEGLISGIVSDSKTGLALPGAHVFVSEQTGVMTDKEGTFEIILKPGNYSLQIQFIGYQSAINCCQR